jgi:hypothetical protein
MRRFRKSAQAQRNMAQRKRRNTKARNQRQRTRQKERSIRQAKRKAAQKARQKQRTKRVQARQRSRAQRIRAKAQGGAFVGRQQALSDIGTTALSEAANIGAALTTGGASAIGEGLFSGGGNGKFSGLKDKFQDFEGFGDGTLSGALDTFGDAFGGGGPSGGGGGMDSFSDPFLPDFQDEEIEEEVPFYENPVFLIGGAAAIYFLFFRK